TCRSTITAKRFDLRLASDLPKRKSSRKKVNLGRLLLASITIAIFWVVQASALLAFITPFSWGLVALWAASHFIRAIGLTLTFHRYFAHRAFQMNRAARFLWAAIGTAAMQKGPLWWAGHHVSHHRFADREGDPHSPLVSGVYYAHIGWFLN